MPVAIIISASESGIISDKKRSILGVGRRRVASFITIDVFWPLAEWGKSIIPAAILSLTASSLKRGNFLGSQNNGALGEIDIHQSAVIRNFLPHYSSLSREVKGDFCFGSALAIGSVD